MTEMNRQVVLRQRPAGLLTWDDLEIISTPRPELAEGEALIETMLLGMDATVRTWLNRGEGYLPAVGIGEVVRCSGIGRVVESRCDKFAVGDLGYGLPGWQQYAIVRDDLFTTWLPPDADVIPMMSVYGATGATALFGLTEIGLAKAGETVVVSAAAGSTGSLVGQIAKIIGCRVVGIVGSEEKARFIVDELGFDAAINHRTDDLAAALKEHCPNRVDVYFDNVGGRVLDAVLGGLAMHGRVVLCGAISVYNDQGRPPGPSNYLNLISRRGRMEGFIALDWVERYPESAAVLAEWVADGRLKHFEQFFGGLESSVDALNALFTGANTGKVILRLPTP
ncbi:MAG: NADP-dependent oxidoreductase [Acidimicrobiales bacterium]